MPKYRLASIGQLCRQMGFAPVETRLEQLAGAEALLHSLIPDKAYPYEYVIFRITGYHPKTISKELFTGMALQHDLGLLIEETSEPLDLRADVMPEPVMSIDEVTERFNVTSKTIQRWRRKGLPARRFIFNDGKRRVGFLLSSVEQFFRNHRQEVTRGTNLSLATDTECDEIVRRAKLLASTGSTIDQLSRRIGRKLNRSSAMILQTLRRMGADLSDRNLLSPAFREIVRSEFEFTRSFRIVANELGLQRAQVYQIVLEDQLERVALRKVKFIDDELYHQDDAEAALQAMLKQESLVESSDSERDRRSLRDLPPALAGLCRAPLLSAARERALFLTFNYHKFKFVSARRKLEPELARLCDLKELEGHLERATAVKNEIVRANLRLVVSVAKKHVRPGVSLMELVSEGNLTLMRCVESFDTHTGNRFSTYATLSLMKAFARSVPVLRSAIGQSQNAERWAEIPDVRTHGHVDRTLNREHVRELMSRLDDRERLVIGAQFGLDESLRSLTENDLVQQLGVSRQRLRQIERAALEKLRAAH